jgi:hypothetical protein
MVVGCDEESLGNMCPRISFANRSSWAEIHTVREMKWELF